MILAPDPCDCAELLTWHADCAYLIMWHADCAYLIMWHADCIINFVFHFFKGTHGIRAYFLKKIVKFKKKNQVLNFFPGFKKKIIPEFFLR